MDGGGKDSGNGSDTMVAYGDKSIGLQKEMYDQNRADAMPWYEAGKTGLNTLMDRLGLSGNSGAQGYGTLLKSFSADDMQKDPGYDFRLGEGQKTVERQLAASGKYLAPEASKALTEYGQNFASSEYNNAYNRYNADNATIYDRLAGLSGTGQGTTAQLANNSTNYANSVSDIYSQQANAITAAQQAANNKKSSLFGSLGGIAGTVGGAMIGGPAGAMIGGQLGSSTGRYFSDMRLKENIRLVGEQNGHQVYTFNYKVMPDHKFSGVMAHEVQITAPDAVFLTDSGYLAVDYGKIGVSFSEVQ